MRRRSHQTKLVLQALLDSPTDETYGYALSKATGLPSGVIYPILRRLQDEDLIASRWEITNASENARRRRFYRLTGEGSRVARTETAKESTALRMLSPGWNT
jgi:PadR family transcriptional regulator PadR